MKEWELVLAFDNDDERFVLGFECGQVWRKLSDNAAGQEHTVHSANAEMMLRMAEALERELVWVEQDDGWALAKFGVG